MQKSALVTSARPNRASLVVGADAPAPSVEGANHIAPETLAALTNFERSLEARGAEQTTRRYLQACRLLVEFRGSEPLHQTTNRDAQQLLGRLRSQNLAPRTLATTLSAWKSWFRLLARTDARYRADVFDNVRVPRPPKRLPNALTETEMARLLDTPVDVDATLIDASSGNIRDQAIFELLYGAGMRISELTGLDVDDIDLSAREARVFGKGRKQRILPIGEKACLALERWVAERSRYASNASPPERALFLGERGGRIAATVVRKALAERAIQADLSTHVHPHRLRHSFASHVLQSSRDLRAVQELMGHVSIASTQVYTHLDFQHLAQVYDEAHPRATKKK